MNSSSEALQSDLHRRNFLKWLSLSSLSLALPLAGCNTDTLYRNPSNADLSDVENVFDLERLSREVMGEDAIQYLNGGADDLRTVAANTSGYQRIQIRPRRLIDVRNISTGIELFGEALDNPIILCPVGFQRFFHPDGEIASARASVKMQHKMIVSSVSNFSFAQITDASRAKLWFQLYPSPDRRITKMLLDRVEDVGCNVCVLTVDTPVVGNREGSGTLFLEFIESGKLKMGNFEGILPDGLSFTDPGMTWQMIDWLRANTKMQIVLKGIVTREDALLAREKGADGIIVSNHGGRQLESGRATIDCLPEVVDAVDGAFPVLIDGGIRRGTDIFKALALGAKAVCIGRPYCWGLGARGQQGVEMALGILKSELIRDMQLAGTPSIADITSDFVVS